MELTIRASKDWAGGQGMARVVEVVGVMGLETPREAPYGVDLRPTDLDVPMPEGSDG